MGCCGGSGSCNPNIKKIIRKDYGEIAKTGQTCKGGADGLSCCGSEDVKKTSQFMGYSGEDLINVPEGANLGLGCGNPLAIAALKPGDVVLDLGSGAGFDAFIAARKVGDTGKVYGVDMTEEMIERARNNAIKGGYKNVEFRQGDIESLPISDKVMDVVISNCVINLAPNKLRVFEEAYRVLKTGGRLMVSDIVLIKELTEQMKNDENLLIGCVAGAILKDKYIGFMGKAGFKNIEIQKESSMFLDGYAVSINVLAHKL